MDKQLKDGLPKQYLFMNANGEIMSIEYGKPGFRRSKLSTDNREANREIVNSYNGKNGITAEHVKLMRNGALFGWDMSHGPNFSYRQENNVKGSFIFEIKISHPSSFESNTAAEVSLPATPYELADVLNKARIPDECVFYTLEILSCELDYLPQFISPDVSLYELNYLAYCLSELNEWELECFEGMVMMDTIQNRYAPIVVDRLINMTHSTGYCQIAYEAHDDLTLGRFYTDNGFVPELETLPEKIFPWLDYAKIGKELRESEGGVFTPNGYVVRSGEISEVYKKGDAVSLEKPGYTVLLKVAKGYINDTKYKNDPVAFLKLPADDKAVSQAVEAVDAASLKECTLFVVDCMVPSLTENISDSLYGSDGDSYGLVNELAWRLQQMNEENDILTYKAMLEAAPDDISLEEALDLICQTDRFILLPEITSPASYATKEIQRSISFGNNHELEQFFDLAAYGRYLIEKIGIAETSYGMLEPYNGQTVVQCIDRPSQQIMQ